MTGEERWVLPDRTAALEWCARRKGRHVRCALDVLGRSAKTEDDVQGGFSAHLELLEKIMADDRGASLAVKLSTLGAAFDRALALRNLERLALEGAKKGVALELDMEGRSSVDATVGAALACAGLGAPVTLAVQAYLDRSASDLELISRNGLRPRLVKGACLGDSADYQDISRRMKALAGTLLSSKRPFAVGTHDPELVGWLEHAAGPFTPSSHPRRSGPRRCPSRRRWRGSWSRRRDRNQPGLRRSGRSL